MTIDVPEPFEPQPPGILNGTLCCTWIRDLDRLSYCGKPAAETRRIGDKLVGQCADCRNAHERKDHNGTS